MNKSFSPRVSQPKTDAQGTQLRDAPETDAINLASIMSVIWRGKWIILATFLIGLMVGAYYIYFHAIPMYRSTAVVMLNNREEQVVDLESVIGGLSADASVVNTEVEVLRSRGLLGKVVDELDLTSDPEFNRFLQTPSLVDQIKTQVRQLLPLRGGDTQETLTEEEHTERARAATIDGLLSKLSIQNLPQSLVFQVTVETTTPRKSAEISDTLVDLYILNQIEVKFEATEQATEWLTNRVTELQGQLEEAEAKVTEFRGSIDLIDMETLAAQERQLKDLRDRIVNMRATLQAAEARLAELEAAESPEDRAAAANDAQLSRLLPRVEDEAIGEAFETRFSQIVDRAQLEVQRSETQLATLTTSADELAEQIDRQGADLITLQQLTREAEASRLLYEHFLSRLKETSAQQGIQQADSRVLSNAVVPISASSPKKTIVLAMCGMLGLLFGTALVLLREARQNTFRDSRTLEELTGYSTMGQIPQLPSRTRKDAIAYLAEKPTSAAAEAIRNLRTSILLSNVDQEPQVIMTSSSVPGEGKTTIAMALGQNFSGMGKKVLLIEGDIRRRVFRQYLGDEKRQGLISVLTGTSTLSEAVFRDDRFDADILIGEQSSANAADLFSSEKFAQMIEEARHKYDQIVIDTAPVLVVPDGRIIAQLADALLFVVQWDRTSKDQVREALRMFESINRPASGLVLNQISPRGMKRYGYGGRYGAYSSYGQKYYVN